MAQQTISDEELQLKKRARRRLVGAIALVIAAVVFLPMVLDKEPKPVGQDIAIHIPSQEDTSFKTSIPPAVAAAPVQQTGAAVPQKPAESTPPPVEAAKPEASGKPVAADGETNAAGAKTKETGQKAAATDGEKPVQAGVAEKPGKPAAEPKRAHAAKSQGFVILLGAFANMENARQRQATLTQLGVRFYSEKVKTPSGEKLRVRAGPYVTRDEAEKVLARLKAQGIKDGMVAEKN